MKIANYFYEVEKDTFGNQIAHITGVKEAIVAIVSGARFPLGMTYTISPWDIGDDIDAATIKSVLDDNGFSLGRSNSRFVDFYFPLELEWMLDNQIKK